MGRASVPTPALYPAFFFVLEKAVKSARNVAIPTFPAHCPHGLQHLRHKRSTFAFADEIGYTLGSSQRIAHSDLHAETRGVLDRGAITTLGAFRTFTKIPGPGVRTAYFAAFWSWSDVLQKNVESLRNSDALIRVAVPRRRGPVGLRDLFRFCRNCGLYTLGSPRKIAHKGLHGETRGVLGGGAITTLGAFRAFRKPCVAGA